MIYYSGDIHGSRKDVVSLRARAGAVPGDTIILLGDVGVNYYGDKRDRSLKQDFDRLGVTVLCIHGNHEMRPENIKSYKQKEWNGGTVFYEDTHPRLLFAKDGSVFDIEGIKHLAIGGAYSVDKHYRLSKGWSWWQDEQPSDETKKSVEKLIQNQKEYDVILTHTCPRRYEPVEAFLDQIDQSTVDHATEDWLDEVEQKISYRAWMCGHYHITKHIDKIWFLYHDIKSLDHIGIKK